MDNNILMEIIAESMDIEVDELELSNNLSDYDEWDSLAVLTLMSFCNERVGKIPNVADVKKCVTVEDVLNIINSI